MALLTVQFSSYDESEICSYFGSPQDPESYQNLGEVDSSDPRWKVYYDSVPIFARVGLPIPD